MWGQLRTCDYNSAGMDDDKLAIATFNDAAMTVGTFGDATATSDIDIDLQRFGSDDDLRRCNGGP
uniref:Uncharacterized protein n=1 Tax=Arundo donax TaxID=35708 RepID=A0A0A9G0K6_ARUDO